jgi:hypothetical protein
LYYYNAGTNQSTYTRPQASAASPQNVNHADTSSPGASGYNNWPRHGTRVPEAQTPHAFHAIQDRGNWTNRGDSAGRHNSFHSQGRRHPRDRPKSKHVLPDCEPWLLIKTKLERRFVYHPERGESFWKIPQDIQKSLDEFDRREREGISNEASVNALEVPEALSGGPSTTDNKRAEETATGPREGLADEGESDEYEEVEVTDDEEEEHPSKRQRTGAAGKDQPLEFNEDDIAYQLAAMGHEYGLDPGEYGDGEGEGEWEEGAQGLELTKEDAANLFKDLLNDMEVNPFKPWDQVIEEGLIIDDDRYTVLPNMKSRKKVWTDWSGEKVELLREKRKNEVQEDVRFKTTQAFDN